MKQLVYFVVILALLSCNKKPDSPLIQTSTLGSIHYKLNGQLIMIDNINVENGEAVAFTKQLQRIALPYTRYLLNAQKKPGIFLTITLVTDTLNESNYYYDSAIVNNNFSEFIFDLDNNGESRSLYFSSDSINVHISSYKNSRISGTFKARLSAVTGSLSDYTTRGSIYITDGVFDNVPVSY